MIKLVTEGTKRYLKVEIPKFPTLPLPRIPIPKLSVLRLPSVHLILGLLALVVLAAFMYIAFRVFMNVSVEAPRPPLHSVRPKTPNDSYKPISSAESTPTSTPKTPVTTEKKEASGSKEVQKSAELEIKAGIFVAKLKAGTITKEYTVTPVATAELVQGNKGKYFLVELLDTATTKPIYFPNGKYMLNELEPNFAKSLNQFNADVLSNVGILGARVFVQGKADSLAAQFNSTFNTFECNGELAHKISFHPNVGASKYRFSESYKTREIGSIFGNDELPFLRARFLQCRLQAIYDAAPTEVLEGEVDPLVNPQSRSGTFILYVPQR